MSDKKIQPSDPTNAAPAPPNATQAESRKTLRIKLIRRAFGRKTSAFRGG